MGSEFEKWWYSRPSYKESDREAAEEAWDAAMAFFEGRQKANDAELLDILVPTN